MQQNRPTYKKRNRRPNTYVQNKCKNPANKHNVRAPPCEHINLVLIFWVSPDRHDPVGATGGALGGRA